MYQSLVHVRSRISLTCTACNYQRPKRYMLLSLHFWDICTASHTLTACHQLLKSINTSFSYSLHYPVNQNSKTVPILFHSFYQNLNKGSIPQIQSQLIFNLSTINASLDWGCLKKKKELKTNQNTCFGKQNLKHRKSALPFCTLNLPLLLRAHAVNGLCRFVKGAAHRRR